MSSSKFTILLNTRLFKTLNAFKVAVAGSVILTSLMTLTYVDKDWVLDSNYHFFFTFFTNTTIIFSIIGYSFLIIRSQLQPRWKNVFVIVGSMAIAVVVSLLSNQLHILIYNSDRLSKPDSLNLTHDIIIAIVSVIFSLTLYIMSRRHQFRIEREQLQTENILVRYESLEKQLDPHFLFNSLNTLSGLIGNDENKAQIYLQHLASTYRYIMQNRRLVDLEEELQFTKTYYEMMQIRYGDNVHITQNIDQKLFRHQIIPISIQLLIENAFKHNIVSGRHPLSISLSTTDDGYFMVSNAIQPKQETSSSTGLGLANLAKRYELLCDKNIIISDHDGIFSVKIPIIDPKEASKILNRLHNNKITR